MSAPLDLEAIEQRFRDTDTSSYTAGRSLYQVAQDSADDVPALVAEVRRLQAENEIDGMELVMRVVDRDAEIKRLRGEIVGLETILEDKASDVAALQTAFATLDYILGNIDWAADVYEERWETARKLIGWSPAWGDGLLESSV